MLAELVEQRLGVFEIGGIEAFGEPAVDGCQQTVRCGPPALLTPQPGEARRGAQLKRFRLLPPSGIDSLRKPRLALTDTAARKRQSPSQAINFRFPPALATFLRNGVSISQSRASAVVVP